MKKPWQLLVVFSCLVGPSWAMPEAQLAEVQHAWAKANYATPQADQEKAFADLTEKLRLLHQSEPNDPEALIWLAITLSSDAGATGGLSALGKIKEARTLLEETIEIDGNALQGSAYTSLGSLYYKAPGWPLSFGNDDKAEKYLQKALTINPKGIDPNFFYGEFLLEQGRTQEALQYLDKALAAAPRENRPLADEGRKKEIQSVIQITKGKM